MSINFPVGVLYFISMMLFLILQTNWALTFWETMTVIGAVIMLIVLTVIAEEYSIKAIFRRFMLISLSGTVFLTSIAHFTSIGVIRKLTSQGVSVPDYFKIGFFPSLEMTLDYIAWGLFMGLAFLVLYFGINNKALKIFSISCGILCLIGFIGSFFLESLWYVAPLYSPLLQSPHIFRLKFRQPSSQILDMRQHVCGLLLV